MARALKIHRKGIKFTYVLHPGEEEGKDSCITEKDGGCSSYLLREKRVVLVLLRVFCPKRSTAGAFAVSNRKIGLLMWESPGGGRGASL